MPNMIVTTPDETRTLDDWDITFASGMVLPLTLDAKAGDTISFTDNEIQVKLVAKPNVSDPNKLLPAEDVTIYKAHVATVQHRERTITELTPEEKLAWQKTLHELTKTIQ